MKTYFLCLLILVLDKSRAWSCPSLQKTQLIQEEFQLLQKSNVALTEEQLHSLKEIIEQNSLVLKETECYVESSQEVSHLNDFLSHLKLQVLDLRYNISLNKNDEIKLRLLKLRNTISILLKKQNYLSRRLGASVRSLYLDELERLIRTQSKLVYEQLDGVLWVPNVADDLQIQFHQNVEQVRGQFKKLKTPKQLAEFFGKRPWRPIAQNKSKLIDFLSDLKIKKSESLESQLLFLFSSNTNNLKWQSSEKNINYYLNYVSTQLKGNVFVSAKNILEPVIEKELLKLKTEMGLSWQLISGLAGVRIEGHGEELTSSIDLLDPFLLEKSQIAYSQINNPLGRLYELVILKQLSQMWTDIDIVQLKTDLNRISLLKTNLAVQSYKDKFKKSPKQINDLITKKIIDIVPRDYFTGEVFKFDFASMRVWSVGENKSDENGFGDDIATEIK